MILAKLSKYVINKQFLSRLVNENRRHKCKNLYGKLNLHFTTYFISSYVVLEHFRTQFVYVWYRKRLVYSQMSESHVFRRAFVEFSSNFVKIPMPPQPAAGMIQSRDRVSCLVSIYEVWESRVTIARASFFIKILAYALFFSNRIFK